MIFFVPEKLCDFFCHKKLHDFFGPERLHDFFLSQEVAQVIFVPRGCVICFWSREVA